MSVNSYIVGHVHCWAQYIVICNWRVTQNNSFVANQDILLADTILVSSSPIGMLVLFGNLLGKWRADILFLEGKDQTLYAQRKVFSTTTFSLLRTIIPLSVGTYLWRKDLYYIHTEKYSPKSCVINFRTQISSSQSEERTMVFTREKNDTSNQHRERCFFTCENFEF